MARYINADAFLGRVESMYCLGCEKRMGIKNGKKKFIYGIGDAPCRSCDVDDMKYEIDNAPTADEVEIKKEGEWEMFDLISSAYYGKRMYFEQDAGTVYSRYSHKCISVDEAIREFISLIDGTEANDDRNG